MCRTYLAGPRRSAGRHHVRSEQRRHRLQEAGPGGVAAAASVADRGVRRALRTFAELTQADAADERLPPENPRWTTLDLVLLARLAAHQSAKLPTSPELLYDEILTREFDYWTRVGRQRGTAAPPRDLLPVVGACVTLLGPTPRRLAHVLAAVPQFEEENRWREEWAEVAKILIPPDTDSGTVALRPDPIGERLVLRELTAHPELAVRCIDAADGDEQLNARLIHHPRGPA